MTIPDPHIEALILAVADILSNNTGYRFGSDRVYNFDSKCSELRRNSPTVADAMMIGLDEMTDQEWINATGMHPMRKAQFILKLQGRP